MKAAGPRPSNFAEQALFQRSRRRRTESVGLHFLSASGQHPGGVMGHWRVLRSPGRWIVQSGLGIPWGLVIRTKEPESPGEKVRSDKAGFRFLVEDADGSTVVDLDLPSNSASRNIRNTGNKYRGQGPWSVPTDKRSLRYRSKGVAGMLSTVKINRSDKQTNE